MRGPIVFLGEMHRYKRIILGRFQNSTGVVTTPLKNPQIEKNKTAHIYKIHTQQEDTVYIFN